MHYAVFNDQSFNDTLTNDIVSSEQLGPGFSYMSQIKRKSAFKHAQNAQIQIILHMPKVSSGPLLADSEGLDQLSAYVQKHVFAWRGPYIV